MKASRIGNNKQQSRICAGKKRKKKKKLDGLFGQTCAFRKGTD